MRPARFAAVASVVLTVACAAPANPERTQSGPPPCNVRAGDRFGSAVLVAQAVPTASLLPCVKTLPVGWSTQSLQARNGRAYFGLDSDRDGVGAVDVTLTRKCEVRGATEVPSERAGARRFELVTRVTPGYVGDRFYVFDGGCITYHFNLRGTTRGEPLAGIAQGVGFVSRDTVRELVREASDGRLHLDPVPE
jgi:hypothetical protein